MAWFGPDPQDEIKAATDLLHGQVHTLTEENSLLKAVLTNLTEAVLVVDARSQIQFLNSAMAKLFQTNPDIAQGRLFLEVIRQSELNDLVQKVLTEFKHKSAEVHILSTEEHLVDAHVVPLGESAKASGALLVLRDITTLRRLEKVRRDFVANVSHELRTPLTSIKGFAETLRDGALSDPRHALEFVQSIEKHADNMISLVSDLLDLTMIESGQRTAQPNRIAVSEIVADIVKDFAVVARKKNIELTNETTATTVSVQVDKKHLRQILLNLIENAIKFSDSGGWVQIEAANVGPIIEITVSDNGPGIPAQDLDRIFERFYRADSARSRDNGGTGLGLSIVKHLTEINHGHVRVQSSVGKGSRFTVSLPAA